MDPISIANKAFFFLAFQEEQQYSIVRPQLINDSTLLSMKGNHDTSKTKFQK